MRKIQQISVVVICLLALIACGGQKAIIIDTTGLTPEQAAAVEWKAKYAVALDWYEAELKSYEVSLDILPLDQANAIHAIARPVINTVTVALKAFQAAAYSVNPDAGDQQAAYDAYLASKAALLKLLLTLFN